MDVRKVFRIRLIAEFIMIIAWSSIVPVASAHYNIIGSTLVSLLMIAAMVIGLGQSYLRQKFSLLFLLKSLIVLDIVYIVIVGGIIMFHISDFTLLIVDSILNMVIGVFVVAGGGKLETEYMNTLDEKERDAFRAKYLNIHLIAKILAFALGGIIGGLTDNLEIVFTIKIIIMAMGGVIEVYAIKQGK